MNKKFVLITLAGSLLVSTGCTKSRWFTRKDYAESQDPFMEAEAVASTSGADKAGRATLDDSPASSGAVADTRPLSGPKPIQRVGSLTDPANPGPPVSRAVYPESEATAAVPKNAPPGVTRSYQGSELSGYLQKRRAEIETKTADVTSQTGQAISNEATAAKATATALTTPRQSPAAKAAAMPKLSEEAEGFNSFLEQGARTADSAASTARNAAATVQETEDAAAGFADFAAQKKAEWSTEASNAPATIRKTAGNAASSARSSAQTVIDDFVEQVNTPAASSGSEFDPAEFAADDASAMSGEEDAESAQPLIKKPAAAASEFDANPFEEFEAPAPRAATPKAARPVAAKTPAPKAPAAKPAPAASSDDEFEENPFENPFAEARAKAATPKSSASKAAGSGAKVPASSGGPAKKAAEPAVDDSFGFGTGWKPANLSTP